THPASHAFPTRRSSDLRSYYLLAWVMALLLHGGVIVMVANWPLAVAPAPQAPQSLDVLLVSQPLPRPESPQPAVDPAPRVEAPRSEEHTSELQSRFDLV